MAWIQPVYDRTQADIDSALQKIKEWISADQPETYELKGCLNVTDINRIEENIQFLADTLLSLDYEPNVLCKAWQTSGLPTLEDFSRILNNVQALITSYYQQKGVPEVPYEMLNYQEINDVELNLQKIKELVDCMILFSKKSGTFQSGSLFFLPKQRGG